MEIKLTIFCLFVSFSECLLLHIFLVAFPVQISGNFIPSLQRDTRGHGNCDAVMNKSWLISEKNFQVVFALVIFSEILPVAHSRIRWSCFHSFNHINMSGMFQTMYHPQGNLYLMYKTLKAIYIFRNTHINISKIDSVKKVNFKFKDIALKCKNVLEFYKYERMLFHMDPCVLRNFQLTPARVLISVAAIINHRNNVYCLCYYLHGSICAGIIPSCGT